MSLLAKTRRQRSPFLAFALSALLVFSIAALIIWRLQSAEVNRIKTLYAQAKAAILADGLPLTSHQVVPNYIPDAQNAAPLYLSIFTDFKAHPQWRILEANALSVFANFPPNAKALRIADRYVQATRPEMAKVEKAVQLPYCDFHYDWNINPLVSNPSYADFRTLARLIALDAVRLDREGKPIEALDRLAVGARMVRQITSADPSLIAFFVSAAINTIFGKAWTLIVQHRSHDLLVLQHAQKVNHLLVRSYDPRWFLRYEVYETVWLGDYLHQHPQDALQLIREAGGFNAPPPQEAWWKRLWRRFTGQSGPIPSEFSPLQIDLLEARALAYYDTAYRIFDSHQGDVLAAQQAIQELDARADALGNSNPREYMLLNARVPLSNIMQHLLQVESDWWQRELLVERYLYRCEHGHAPSDVRNLPAVRQMPASIRWIFFLPKPPSPTNRPAPHTFSMP
ncbi:MAG TPA: hypothetical protein VKV18_00020 [Chthonomonas sp.]|uniref:hypothetical protein n=1 Tax=Chthonomonas sp. TaxID=2282153 RepID=UPI002B4B72B7|nr:hypothetical protein [Chthonomonas sp.]HLI47066.1 hypothetical protein [Chthonomonas sp.]